MTQAEEKLVTANTRIPRIIGLFAPGDTALTYKGGGFGSVDELKLFAAKEKRRLLSHEESERWELMTEKEAVRRGLEYICV